MNSSKQSPLLSPPFPWMILSATFILGAPVLSANSLWTAPGSTERCMYADRKAGSKGDILTVVVSEIAAQSSSKQTKTANDSSVENAVTQFLFPTAASKFGTHNGALPGMTFGGKNSFTGGGQISNTQTVSGTAAVVVTEVLPNGNLVIEGVRRMTFSGETQHIVLHGVVRPDDISPLNTISSNSIANARIEFVSEGELTNASKKGWINKLYDLIRPF
jgi:flagellar L-ring protein FlgH